MDQSMIDTASGGALMDKTPTIASHLISNMASNTQQFGIRGASQSRMVNEISVVDNLRLKNQLTELTSLVRQLAVRQHQPNIATKVCDICTSAEHTTNMCPTLQEIESDYPESVGAIGSTTSSNNNNNKECQLKATPSLEDLMKQLTPIPANYELQQYAVLAKYERHYSRPKDANRTVSQYYESFIVVTLRSGKELPHPAPQQLPRLIDADFVPNADSKVPQQDKIVTLSFPTRTFSVRKPKSDEELLRMMFRKVEINIPFLDAIKQIPKYAKFLKKLCVHKRKKMKGMSALTRNEDFTTGAQQALPKKCQDPIIFSVPCTIGDCTFVNAMLDLRASINVMPTSIYKSLNFGDLEPIRMIIQLANRSVVQPLGILKDVLVQVNELIFPADFYVLDMEDETLRKGSTLILGRLFLMTAKTKIDVHVETLSMEFDDTLVQFNIFEAMKHPTEDHSLFGIDLIDELIEECIQLGNSSENISDFARDTDSFDCLGSITEEADYDELWEVHNLSDSEDNNINLADLSQETELLKLLAQVHKHENPECSSKANIQVAKTKRLFPAQVQNHVPSRSDSSVRKSAKFDSNPIRANSIPAKRSRPQQLKAEIMSAHLVPISNDNSSSPPPPRELKPLPSHLKYAYLDTEQQLLVIIASNLHQEQEDKLLHILRQHKKAIRWKLSDFPRINPSICMHKILMEEEARPIRQQQRRINLTILDVVKEEVTKLLAVGIIYPISDNQWVSLVQVVPKKSGLTVMKNQHDELVLMQIHNSWRATRKDHFPLPFIDQVLEKLARKSHYCFLDGFSRYMQIHIAPEDQHMTTFTYPFGTFAYTRLPFGLCNAPSTFQRCMTSIFSNLLQDCMEVFMDDFTVYADSFDACLENLTKVLIRCIDTNLVLNFEKCHFMVTEGIVLGHLVSNRGIEVDKSKIDIITSLPNPASMREVHSFLGHAGFYRRFIKNFSKIALPLYKLLQKDVEFKSNQPCIEAFQELKNQLTSSPILQAPD
ncbi:Retrovirus-related Pol polyprotein from transposon 17.6, partial [Mucuna pruriens]